MDAGILNLWGFLGFRQGANVAQITKPDTLAASYVLEMPVALPTVAQGERELTIIPETNTRGRLSLRPLGAAVARASFTNANLISGRYTFTHNLGNQFAVIQVYDNLNEQVLPDEIVLTSDTVATIDLVAYGTITGTWNVVGMG